MKTKCKTARIAPVERRCSVCRRVLLVQSVRAFLDRSALSVAFAGATENLRRIEKKRPNQTLTWCGSCWRFALPSESAIS